MLSHVFSKAEKEWGYLSANPVRSVSKPREPRGRVRYLTKEELARLSEACKLSRNPHLHMIFILAVSTGMRLGEIRNLRKTHVELQRRAAEGRAEAGFSTRNRSRCQEGQCGWRIMSRQVPRSHRSSV
jgi:integrase